MTREQPNERDTVIDQLTRSARKRWAVLGVGLFLLALLFIFAGMIRTPGARKNPYTVIASRALAVVGAILLTRIVLLTNDDGTPVFLLGCGAGPEALAGELGLIDERYEVIPLRDVVAFIRDQRYVPKKGVAVVIEVASREDLLAAAGALSERGSFPATLLLGEAVISGISGGGAVEMPAGISLAVRAGGADDEAAIAAIESVSAGLEKAAGRRPEYALLEGDEGLVLGRVGKATGIEAFFGGDGLNRYGDRGNRIRLANIGAVVAAGSGRGARLGAYTTMYRGNYLPYPVWIWFDRTSPLERRQA